MPRLLEIENLTLEFETANGPVQALRGITLAVDRGECVALVGESGSGKSVTGMTIMRLLGANARISAGTIRFDGQDLIPLSERQMRGIRGKRIAMVFQNAKASLNPIRRVGDTLTDILLAHDTTGLSRRAAREKIVGIMGQIGIALPEKRMENYPAELSGGMCQRISIAAALACEPELIIADEPTSALDVTTQQMVMDTLISACRDRGVAVIFITHDLALASEYCDRGVVMNTGRVVEEGSAGVIFTDPRHPYTRALLDALPYGKSDAAELRPMTGDFSQIPPLEGRADD